MTRRCWLMKSEPEVYSIADLEHDGESGWEGVRNYQARNLMRDEMKVGDAVIFYHSNAQPSGIAGLAKVVSQALPDPSQFDPKSEYFDETSTRAEPRWVMVKIGFVEMFAKILPLETLKADPKLKGLPLLQKGQRLSVQPVDPAHYTHIVELARRARR